MTVHIRGENTLRGERPKSLCGLAIGAGVAFEESGGASVDCKSCLVKAGLRARGAGMSECKVPSMTLREYYAGLAMQAFAANPELAQWTDETVAERAVEQADALLIALANAEDAPW